MIVLIMICDNDIQVPVKGGFGPDTQEKFLIISFLITYQTSCSFFPKKIIYSFRIDQNAEKEGGEQSSTYIQ